VDLHLADKVAIVTGGGRGIGEAICMAFAKEGSDVVVTDIDEKTAKTVSNNIKGLGRKSFPVKTDVSNQNEVIGLMESVITKLGRIDILVNNAGIAFRGKGGGPILTWEIEPKQWDTVMGVNLKGVLFCSQGAVKHMLPRKQGTIVNISSIAGKAPFEPMATGAEYFTSKAAVINLTQRMAHELAPHGIRVNAVAPGRIESPMSKTGANEVVQRMLQRIPMGRFGTPEEIANLVLFLASDASRYITGETVNINGGWFMD
jgi:3-oxoacyl-[acyl-carrier protein] reductase